MNCVECGIVVVVVFGCCVGLYEVWVDCVYVYVWCLFDCE